MTTIAPALVALCLLAFPALTQPTGENQRTDNQAQVLQFVSASARTKQKVDSLQRLTQPRYYTAALTQTKRMPLATARLANKSGTCYSYLCGIVNGEVITITLGEWNDPAIWSVSRVPTSNDIVRIRHQVIIPTDYNAAARLVRYDAGGKLVPATRSRLRLGQ